MGDVMDGEATPAQLGGPAHGSADAWRDGRRTGRASPRRCVSASLRVEAPVGAIDVVGTGGDGSGSFNISTAAALVVAAAGYPGRQARQPGDHLEGRLRGRARRARRPDRSRRRLGGAALRETGFAFMFAPSFHPAMRHAGPTRREIGVRTAFNLLGPLTNPAGRLADAPWRGRRRRGARSPRSSTGWARNGRSSSTVTAWTSCRSMAAASSTTSDPAGIEQRAVDAERRRVGPNADGEAGRWGSADDNARFVESVLRGEPGARRDVVSSMPAPR